MERASILVENGDTVDAPHLYFSYPQNLLRLEPVREARQS
jgi:hypothetical protein